MGFEKGNTLGGKKKGTKNKVTKAVKQGFEKLLNDNLNGLQSDLESLKPSERLKIILDLANYVLPKMKAIEMDVTSGGEALNMPMINFIKRKDKD